jgi:hypothetical protein
LADPTVTRERTPYLAGAWLFAAASVVGFAWLTAGPYVRQNLRPLPGEAATTMRDCGADPSCAPEAAELVDRQLTLLGQSRTVVHLSAWTISILALVVVAVATVLLLRGRRGSSARVLGVLWKVQLAWTAALLAGQVVMLARGAGALGDTPPVARMFTFIKAFDSPFTDVGHLYYVAWLAGVGLVAALLTRTLATRA